MFFFFQNENKRIENKKQKEIKIRENFSIFDSELKKTILFPFASWMQKEFRQKEKKEMKVSYITVKEKSDGFRK